MRRILPKLTFLFALTSLLSSIAEPQEANAVAEARQILREASQLIKDIPEGQQQSATANIAGQLARAGDLQAALATANGLKDSVDKALPLGIVAAWLDHLGNSAGALNLLENSDLGQNKAQAYQQLALSHLNRGDFTGAIRVMDLAGANPYVRVDLLVRIAGQKGKSGDLAGAREAIEEAVAIVERTREEDPNCVGTLAGIAGTQAEIGDLAGALDTLNRFSEMIHQRPSGKGMLSKDTLLSELAIGQAKTGSLTDAFQTIDELPEGGPRNSALENIAIRQAEPGDFQEAPLTASRILDPRLKALTFREIAIFEGTSGKPLEAVETTKSLSSLADRADALASVALEQAEKQDPAAGGTLQLAIESANEGRTTVPGHVFEYIAVTKALLKDFSGAQESIASMNDVESRVWPLWNITEMMAEAGDVQGALSLASNEQAAHPKAYALLGTAQGILSRLDAEAREKSKGSLN